MPKSLSLRDRVGYAAVAGFLGTFVGSLLALLGFILGHPSAFAFDVLLFSVAVFAGFGFALGSRAADFVAMCLNTIFYGGLAALGTLGLDPQKNEFSPWWQLIPLLLYFAGVIYFAIH